MKLSKDTLNILKNFSSINSGIMLKKGKFIMTRSVTGTIYGDSTISDEIDIEAAIYDLPGFLSILGLVGEDANISISNDQTTLVIKDQRSTIHWPIADASTIAFPNKPIPFPMAKVIFELKGEDLQQLMRVSRGLQIDTLAITNKDGNIEIRGYNGVSDSSLTNVLYSLQVGEYDGTTDFNFVINMSNMKMIPADYKVMLWAQDKKFACKFEGGQSSYVIAMEATSTHGF
ncbi:DNA polymerase processivity factor [Escherichia phage EcS1]|uniref:Sliding clamp n=1 Tax=Escherichia phage EcS1 TaxID=2083276 RepID=A0A2Z5ZCA1_9CAUD|nr:DNA polymerase processivity factor [Escherichia phage EcS1]BBC78097.1 Sliding clamp protein [Escherichia phage EcS1]